MPDVGLNLFYYNGKLLILKLRYLKCLFVRDTKFLYNKNLSYKGQPKFVKQYPLSKHKIKSS